jgi:hypothetical protein
MLKYNILEWLLAGIGSFLCLQSLIQDFGTSCHTFFLLHNFLFLPHALFVVSHQWWETHFSIYIYIQWNLYSSFLPGVWKRNDGSGKTVDAGAYIKLIKTIRFALMYLLDHKTYTNNVIASTVKSTLHYFFFRKSLIFICLVAPFLFNLNNKLSILTMFILMFCILIRHTV